MFKWYQLQHVKIIIAELEMENNIMQQNRVKPS